MYEIRKEWTRTWKVEEHMLILFTMWTWFCFQLPWHKDAFGLWIRLLHKWCFINKNPASEHHIIQLLLAGKHHSTYLQHCANMHRQDSHVSVKLLNKVPACLASSEAVHHSLAGKESQQSGRSELYTKAKKRSVSGHLFYATHFCGRISISNR